LFASLLIGTGISVRYDGSLYLMALTSAGVGVVIFGTARVLSRYRGSKARSDALSRPTPERASDTKDGGKPSKLASGFRGRLSGQ
jgi:hypothetical protein